MTSVPKEIQGISASIGETGKVVNFVDERDKLLHRKVAGEAQKVVPAFTAEEAAPSASEPVPPLPALRQVKAERVGAEPFIDTGDIVDFVGKVAGHATELVDADKGILHRVEAASNTEAHPAVIERAKKIQKAA